MKKGDKLWKLFSSMLYISAFTFGGGYAAMPLIQNQVVGVHSWLSMNEFIDLITIAEMTPGPIAINSATFVGIRIAGIPGALVATFGCILPSCFIVSLLAYIYRRYKSLSALQSVLSCLRPAVVALIAAAGCSILQLVAFGGAEMRMDNLNCLALGLFGAALMILRWKKWNPIIVMVLCGAVYLAINLLPGQ